MLRVNPSPACGPVTQPHAEYVVSLTFRLLTVRPSTPPIPPPDADVGSVIGLLTRQAATHRISKSLSIIYNCQNSICPPGHRHTSFAWNHPDGRRNLGPPVPFSDPHNVGYAMPWSELVECLLYSSIKLSSLKTRTFISVASSKVTGESLTFFF